MLQWGCRPGWD